MRSGADFRFALLGKDIAQSASPRLHKAIGVSLGLRVEYTLLDVDKSGLSRCLGELRDGRWDGFNVTAPYKVALAQEVDELRSLASEVGAVNTIGSAQRRLWGANTDGVGVEELLSGLRRNGSWSWELGAPPVSCFES